MQSFGGSGLMVTRPCRAGILSRNRRPAEHTLLRHLAIGEEEQAQESPGRCRGSHVSRLRVDQYFATTGPPNFQFRPPRTSAPVYRKVPLSLYCETGFAKEIVSVPMS